MKSTADTLAASLQDIDINSFPTEAERVKAREALSAALRRVQTPFDVGWQQGWADGPVVGVIRTLIDAGFWKRWVASGGEASHVDGLENSTGVQAAFLRRLLRILAGQHIVMQVGVDTYALTSYSRALGDDHFASILPYREDLCYPCFTNYPKFAAETGYKHSTDPTYTNFHNWKDKNQSIFSMVRDDPKLGVHFNNAMALYSNSKVPWTELFPTESIIAAASAKPERAVVVELGGGTGHDLEKFRAKHPDLPRGSLVLQEQAHVVERAKIQPPCIAQVHDFFQPNPAQGARVYYMHTCLHDWHDEDAANVLKQIAAAMEKGYSKVLIHEAVITPTNADPRATVSDIIMMILFNGYERTEEMWEDVAQKAGLKVVKIWSSPGSGESVIEMELQ